MNNGKIEIELQLKENQRYNLILTSQNYKEEFKQFIREHNINQPDAYYLKNLVQAKMINLYKKYMQDGKKKSACELSHTVNQSWHEGNQSPKFGKIGEQKQTQTFQAQPKEEGQVKYFKKTNKQSKQSLFSTNLPSIGMNNLAQKNEESQQKIWHKYQQEEQECSFLHNKHYHQLSSPQITTVKKHTNHQQKTPSTKHKTIMKDSMSQNFNRLYEASTESFRNKKNAEMNHKEYRDFLQVEKYLMNQNLKRTKQYFFNHLHNKSTESFKAKQEKQKSIEKQKEIASPVKKVSLSKSFKGSKWSSGSRCEMKLLEQSRRKQQQQLKAKQLSIQKRIKQQRKQKKSKQKIQVIHQSRSCQKCNPKTPQKPKKKYIPTKKMPQPIKSAPRPYISNLLAESYQQFTNQFSHF